MTCHQVTGVAREMKKKFGDNLDLSVHLNDSKEAESVELTASSTVFIDDEWINLEVAKSRDKMQVLLSERILG